MSSKKKQASFPVLNKQQLENNIHAPDDFRNAPVRRAHCAFRLVDFRSFIFANFDPSETMKGLTWQSLKANYSLVPLFSIVTLGMVMAAGHAFRCLAFSTDVKINRRNPDRPWDSHVNDDGSFRHAKYVRINDYNKLKKSEYEIELNQ